MIYMQREGLNNAGHLRPIGGTENAIYKRAEKE